MGTDVGYWGGGYQCISVSITMIDRLRLLEVIVSIFVSITIMDLSLNMNDNLELFIRKYNIVGLNFSGYAFVMGLCLQEPFNFPFMY